MNQKRAKTKHNRRHEYWKEKEKQNNNKNSSPLSCGERWRRTRYRKKRDELIVGVANIYQPFCYCVFLIWTMYSTLIFSLENLFVLAYILHFQGWLEPIRMNVVDKRCMDAIKIYFKCGWVFQCCIDVKLSTQLSFKSFAKCKLNAICSVDVL